jgi:CBS domain-containing protein
METSLLLPSVAQPAKSLNQRNDLHEDRYLELNDSAFCALTDFERESPLTIEADGSIDGALLDMNRFGVHALLVTRQELGGIEQQVVGLITYYEIERKRPNRFSRDSGSSERSNVRVADVMTPWDELALIKYESLQTLTASDLYEMFKGTGLTHLLVIENHGEDAAVARGLLSRAALAKRLKDARNRGSS